MFLGLSTSFGFSVDILPVYYLDFDVNIILRPRFLTVSLSIGYWRHILSAIGWSLFFITPIYVIASFWDSLVGGYYRWSRLYCLCLIDLQWDWTARKCNHPTTYTATATIVMPNFIHRPLSAMVALGCVIHLLNFYYLPELSLGYWQVLWLLPTLQRYSTLQRISVKWRSAAFDISKSALCQCALMLPAAGLFYHGWIWRRLW
jgi:hypothetical protein